MLFVLCNTTINTSLDSTRNPLAKVAAYYSAVVSPGWLDLLMVILWSSWFPQYKWRDDNLKQDNGTPLPTPLNSSTTVISQFRCHNCTTCGRKSVIEQTARNEGLNTSKVMCNLNNLQFPIITLIKHLNPFVYFSKIL
jgi:hypothetical protein